MRPADRSLATPGLDEESEDLYITEGNAQLDNYTFYTSLLQVPCTIQSNACSSSKKIKGFLSEKFLGKRSLIFLASCIKLTSFKICTIE